MNVHHLKDEVASGRANAEATESGFLLKLCIERSLKSLHCAQALIFANQDYEQGERDLCANHLHHVLAQIEAELCLIDSLVGGAQQD